MTAASYNLYRVKRMLSSGATPPCITWFVGDSFSYFRQDRLPFGTLLHWPLPGGISAVWCPWKTQPSATSVFYAGTATAAHPYGSSVSGYHQIENSNLNFRQTGSTPAAGDEWYALGMQSHEWLFKADGSYTPAGGSADRVTRLAVPLADNIANGVNGRPWASGATLNGRLVYYAHTNLADMVDNLTLTDNGFTGTTVTQNLKTDARGFVWRDTPTGAPVAGAINSIATEITIASNLDGTLNIGCLRTNPGGADFWMALCGMIIRRTSGTPGTYVRIQSDVSWSTSGFATNATATQSSPKQFTNDQLKDWLEATTDDYSRPQLVVMHIAMENESVATLVSLYGDTIIPRLRSAYAACGLRAPTFLLLLPPVHTIGSLTAEQCSDKARDWSSAARQLAGGDVAVLDLAAHTDYNRFWSTPTSGAEGWLDSHGGSAFESVLGTKDFTTNAGCSSGTAMDLLDTGDLHLAGQPEAEFWAAKAWELIRSARSGIARRLVTGIP